MHCTKCGTAIPDGAAFCPKCGEATSLASSPQPAAAIIEKPKKISKPVGCLIAAAGVVVLLALIGQCVPAPDTTNATGTANTAAAAGESAAEDPANLPLAVTATQLFNAYEGNEASAQNYFGGRPLLVSGTVEKVSLDFSDDPIVELRTPNRFMHAQAALADDAQGQAGDFSPGDKVKLLCEDVSEVIATPMLKDCRIAPAGQKSQPIVWADDN